ncbi:MAG: helix-turn-helix transcriptional regulator [Kofleriaceae bacterium]|nr:helix-turn-helix transcriptional regulator [Kofleriaceae bacterium]MCL4224534.1 helix-turn-helix domain-containing protein [Myxococcales bacterium]
MVSRARAAARIVEVLDSPGLRALAEPARLEVLRVLLLLGPADIGALASHLPRDRSVVSRHLKTLEDAGLVRAERDGRHRIYELDGAAFIGALERVLGETRALAAVCCPPAAALPVVEPARRRT